MEITMKRHSREELERAIADNELRGFKVVGEIQQLTRGHRIYKYHNHRERYEGFSHTDDSTLYCVKMRGEKR